MLEKERIKTEPQTLGEVRRIVGDLRLALDSLELTVSLIREDMAPVMQMEFPKDAKVVGKDRCANTPMSDELLTILNRIESIDTWLTEIHSRVDL